MSGKLAHYPDVAAAAARLQEMAAGLGVTEFAQVRNLDYVFAPFELYPLAPRATLPLDHITAFAVDMDGTSTTTEPLALHALDYMVRRITGRLTPADWPGLDEHADLPHVIGNSNFRHTEFLLQRYGAALDQAAFTQAFFEALTWTLACMTDTQRRRDVEQNARNCGLAELLTQQDFRQLVKAGGVTADNVAEYVRPLVARFGAAFRPGHEAERVAAALDIYYLRYHAILQELEAGRGDRLAAELLGAGGRRLVEPMPGYEVFVPLIKGWLGPEIEALWEPLRANLLAQPELGHTAAELDACRPRLAKLAERFRQRPAKLALVTASIAYEAHACMREVIAVLAQDVQSWQVPDAVKDRLGAALADYRTVFDGFVCASDAWEARLKPHRDLYALSLFQMSVPRAEYPFVVGLEDTEPGCISLRAAGIGCAVALPNHDTRRQDYAAATAVVRGGLPELMVVRNLLLSEW